MVEAAGVEPASEIAVGRESPCCVRFDWVRSAALKNGQDALQTSPIDLAAAARTEPLWPAYCMTSAHSPQAKPWKTAAYLIKLQVADYSRQLLFCRRLRVPTPRHASHAAIDPVETVTPPTSPKRRRPVFGILECGHSFDGKHAAGCERVPSGSCCIYIILRLIGFRRRCRK